MKDRYLITGFCGFVSYYFLSLLNSKSDEKIEILGIDLVILESFLIDIKGFSNLKICAEQVNMLDYEMLEKKIKDFRPTKVVHLASFSSVGASWSKPSECFLNNTSIFLNLVEVLRRNSIDARVLSVGSSEEYGIVNEGSLPLKECDTLYPSNPYAIARVSQEQLSQLYKKAYGIKIMMTRSFNHIGPRQRDNFVISHFAKEIASAKKKDLKEFTLRTGDTSVVRDFLDVRDVVKAYDVILDSGSPGEVYNICRGSGECLTEIIKKLADIANIKINTIIDETLVRPIDNPVIVGSNEKIRASLGWKPIITLEESLHDVYNYWYKII